MRTEVEIVEISEFYMCIHLQDTMRGFMPEDETPKASDSLECAAHDCPKILRKGIYGSVGIYREREMGMHTHNYIHTHLIKILRGEIFFKIKDVYMN